MSHFKNRFYSIQDFIELVKNKLDRRDGYDPEYMYGVYGKAGPAVKFDELSQVYVSDTPGFDGDDDDANEIYPDEVRLQGLSHLYSCDHFQDVVDLAYKQKPGATYAEVIAALNHYSKFDNFLDLA